MLWQDQTTSAVEQCFLTAKQRAHTDYQRIIEQVVDFDRGLMSPYFESPGSFDKDRNPVPGTGGYFQKYFANAWENGNGPLPALYFNCVRRLVKLRATLFHRRPIIHLERKGVRLADNDPAVLAWRKLERKCRLASRLKALQHATELCESAVGYAAWRNDGMDAAGRPINGRVELDILTPDVVEVYQDDWNPGSLDACRIVAHRLPMPVDTPTSTLDERWIVWERPGPAVGRIPGSTPEERWTCRIIDNQGRPIADWQSRPIPNPLFADNLNLYGLYPYVLFHRTEQTGQIWGQPNETYASMQKAINLSLSLATLRQWASGGVAVLESQTAEKSDIPFGPFRAIRVNPDEDFRFAAMAFDAEGTVKWIETLLKAWAVMDGIHPDALTLSGGAFSNAITAIAKAWDRQDLVDEREDAMPYWEDQLGTLLTRMVVVSNTHSGATEQIPADLEWDIEWAEVSVPTSPQEKEQAFQAACNSGMDDPISRRMREKPGLSRENAEADFAVCLEVNRQRAEALEKSGERQTPETPDGAEQ